MASLRRALLLFVCAATAGASIVGYLVLGGTASRLIVDAALLLSLALIVWFTLTPTVGRIEQMVDVLRALARGDRHQRVAAEEFAGLADVARGVNEVAASLTEHEDANLGPVHSRPRLNTRPSHSQKPAEAAELGQVRVHKRTEPAVVEKPRERAAASEARNPGSDETAAKADTPPPAPAAKNVEARTPPPASGGAILSGDVGEPRVHPKNKPILAPPVGTEPSGPVDVERPANAAPTNDTAVDGPRAASQESDQGSQAPVSVMPTRAELEALFAEFVTAKKGKDESVSDLDLEAFTQTIQGECERLLQAHSCKGVRFEVTEQDGEVSLRPRLIR